MLFCLVLFCNLNLVLKVTELFGGVFAKTDLSEALTEIIKMDPEFDKDTFLLEVEYDIIPNILEAMIRPDLEVGFQQAFINQHIHFI